MEEVLLKQLVRQMKILNFWITFFGVLFLAALIIGGILLFKAVTFIHTSEQKISDVQTKATQTLNVQDQLCSNSSVSNLLNRTTDYCK